MAHNTRIQVLSYDLDEDTGLVKVKKARATYCDTPIFGISDSSFTSSEHKKKKNKKKIDKALSSDEKSRGERSDSLQRAKSKVFDLVVMNDFTYFLTITIDINSLNVNGFDSTDTALVMRKVGNWLNNQVKRKGLIYLLIPEYHEDGKKIHCHALINSVFDFVDSGYRLFRGKSYRSETLLSMRVKHIDKLKVVYNVPDWHYGYSTAIKLDGAKERVASYVTKYITKGNDKIFGKYFWSSKKNTIHEPLVYYTDVNYSEMPEVEYSPPSSPFKFKYQSNICISELDDNLYRKSFQERCEARQLELNNQLLGNKVNKNAKKEKDNEQEQGCDKYIQLDFEKL